MKNFKKLIATLTILVVSSLLVACGSANIEGTWEYEKNSDDMGLFLEIDGKSADLEYKGITYESGFLSVKEKEVSGTAAKGEIKGNTITFKMTSELEEDYGDQFPEYELNEVTYSLSKDKSELTLTEKGGESGMVFKKQK